MKRNAPTRSVEEFLGCAAVLAIAAGCSLLTSACGSPCDPRSMPEPAVMGSQASPMTDTAWSSDSSAFVDAWLTPVSAVPLEFMHSTYSYEAAASTLDQGYRPWPSSVRVHEFVNAFSYGYEAPQDGAAIRIGVTITTAPWNPDNLMARVSIKAKAYEAIADTSLTSPLATQGPIVATDVQLRVLFEPKKVSAYRLIGFDRYEVSQAYDPLGGADLHAGQELTVLYELVPAPGDSQLQSPFYTARLRHRDPFSGELGEIELAAGDAQLVDWSSAPADLKFAAAAAGFGMILAESPYRGGADYDVVSGWATQGLGATSAAERERMIELIGKAKSASEYPYEMPYGDDVYGLNEYACD